MNNLITLMLPVSARDHIEGRDDAPLTLVEYGDYQCPYCREAHSVIKSLQRTLGTKLRFVFRNFPLTQATARTAQIRSNDGVIRCEQRHNWIPHVAGLRVAM